MLNVCWFSAIDGSTLEVHTDKEIKTHDRLTMSVLAACLFFFPSVWNEYMVNKVGDVWWTKDDKSNRQPLYSSDRRRAAGFVTFTPRTLALNTQNE